MAKKPRDISIDGPYEGEPTDEQVLEAVADAAPATPDPWMIIGQLTEALQGLAKAQAAVAPEGSTADLMSRLASALERVAESQMLGSQLIASETRRAHRPSNEVVPNISVFNRRGTMLPESVYKKPPLKCLMMIPWLVEWESITREEVELLNLLQPGDYTLKRTDLSKINVEVKVDYKTDRVTPSRLIMNHETGFNNDNFRLMPALTELLRQILKQHTDIDIRQRAAMVMSDEEEEALIEAGRLEISR